MDDDNRAFVKPAVDKVKDIMQSVYGGGESSSTVESNSGYVNPVKPAGSETAVPKPESPITTDNHPEQPLEPSKPDMFSCSCEVDEYCRA